MSKRPVLGFGFLRHGGSGGPPPFEPGHHRPALPYRCGYWTKNLAQHTSHVLRNQHHSTQLLECLLEEDRCDLCRILGITAVDLYIPIFTFVFGEALLMGERRWFPVSPGGGAGDLNRRSRLVEASGQVVSA